MWSLFTSLELRLVHVRPGVEPVRALFFLFFFPVVKRAHRGVPNARRMHDFFLCNAPAFTFKHCESQKRS